MDYMEGIMDGYSDNELDELVNCAGASEHDAMVDEIDSLKKKVKLMASFLHPCELKAIETMLKNSDHEGEKVYEPEHEDGCGYICSAEEDNKRHEKKQG